MYPGYSRPCGRFSLLSVMQLFEMAPLKCFSLATTRDGVKFSELQQYSDMKELSYFGTNNLKPPKVS
jgi:hypothetical protein